MLQEWHEQSIHVTVGIRYWHHDHQVPLCILSVLILFRLCLLYYWLSVMYICIRQRALTVYVVYFYLAVLVIHLDTYIHWYLLICQPTKFNLTSQIYFVTDSLRGLSMTWHSGLSSPSIDCLLEWSTEPYLRWWEIWGMYCSLTLVTMYLLY